MFVNPHDLVGRWMSQRWDCPTRQRWLQHSKLAIIADLEILNYLKYLSERFNDCLCLGHVILLSADFPEQILNLLSFFSRPGLINVDGLAACLLNVPSFLDFLKKFEHCYAASSSSN